MANAIAFLIIACALYGLAIHIGIKLGTAREHARMSYIAAEKHAKALRERALNPDATCAHCGGARQLVCLNCH